MNGQTQLELLNCGLPQEEEYRNWSRELIKKRIGKNQKLDKYLCENSQYKINSKMLALYNFAEEPLLGKYFSVIFDAKQGIILSKKNSRQIVHRLIKEKLFLGLTFQKYIDDQLGFQYHHAISLWQVLYFSINGYCAENTDWLSLHQMTEYQSQKNYCKFYSKLVNGNNYCFEFENCERNFSKRLAEAITHNSVIGKAFIEAFEERGLHMHLCSQINQNETLVNNSDYLLPNTMTQAQIICLKEIFDQIVNYWHLHYGQ